MPEGKKFSRISVNAAEDDDFVIMAGAPAAADEVKLACEAQAAEDVAGVDEFTIAGEVAADSDQTVSLEPIEDIASDQVDSTQSLGEEFDDSTQAGNGIDDNVSSHTSTYAPAPAANTRPVKDEYRTQTLEDLESVPMSSLQKKVIAALVIFGIAGIVFYIVRYVL